MTTAYIDCLFPKTLWLQSFGQRTSAPPKTCCQCTHAVLLEMALASLDSVRRFPAKHLEYYQLSIYSSCPRKLVLRPFSQPCLRCRGHAKVNSYSHAWR